MGDIFFSVVVPCYNVENSIQPTLVSLYNQLYSNFEIILVNDGSTDGTLEILNQFSSRVDKIVINQKNAGTGAARNAGIKASTGKYIAFLDGDDTWLPEKLSVINSYLINSGSDLICHNEYIVSAENKLIKKNYYGPYVSFDNFLFKGNCLSPSAVVVARSVFDKAGLFDEDRKLIGVEDYDMWLRMAHSNINFEYVADFLGNYVLHGNNISKTFKYFKVEERIIVLYLLKTQQNFINHLKSRKRLFIYYLIKLKFAVSTLHYRYILTFFMDSFALFFLPNFLNRRLRKLDA